MSFISGLASYGKSALSYLSGNSYGASLVKTVALGYAVSQLSDSAKKANNSGSDNIDDGVRLQVAPAASHKIPILYGDAHFGGIISDAEMTDNNKTMYYAVTLSERTGNKLSNGTATSYTFKDVYWNDQRVVFRSNGYTVDYSVDRSGNIDRSLSGFVNIYVYAGSSSEGIAHENHPATIPNADTVIPSWTSSHTMSDLVFAVVKVDYNKERSITGIGDLSFHIASDMIEPGDVLFDYMTNPMYGAGIDSSLINSTVLTQLNTYSKESVTYEDEVAGTATLANRYQINGVIDTAKQVLFNAELIASSAATWVSYDVHNGQWTFVINKPETSVASFSDRNIIGNISLQGTGIKEVYNTVKVEFPHRELRDSADFISIAIPTADRLANEVENRLDISYDIINEPVQAQQLGLIELKQARVDLMIAFETDYSYISLNAGDVIDVSNPRYAYNNKLFRVISIEERQDDDGALSVDILALEYDANVYDLSDLTRYVRSDEDGIITIGSIGTPGNPQVSKIEQDARPRVIIETTTPSGIVDGLEYWISNDVLLDEENRSYRLLAERRPSDNEVFPSGTPVILELDSIPSSDFVVKIRGFNTLTVGPFTDSSGLIEFRPVQTTDAITPDTSFLDQFGNVMLALTVFDLLKGVDDLFAGINDGTGIFDIIFDKFEDVTGIDILGDASNGTLVVSSDLITLDNGTQISAKANSLNFVGNDLIIAVDGNDNVTIDFSNFKPADGINIDNTPQIGQTIAWNGQGWVAIDACCSPDDKWENGTAPDDVDPPPVDPPVACVLNITQLSPQSFYNVWTTTTPSLAPPLVPSTGSFFARFKASTKSQQYVPLTKLSGNAKLYQSDGLLVETLSAGNCIVDNDVIEFPFANRVLGRDYYILLDAEMFEYCGCKNAAITSPSAWSFTTSPYVVEELVMVGSIDEYIPPSLPTFGDLVVSSVGPSGTECVGSQTISVTMNEDIAVTNPNETVEIIESTTAKTVGVLTLGSATISGATLSWTGFTTPLYETTYSAVLPVDCLTTIRADQTFTDPDSCGGSYELTPPQATNDGAVWQFKTPKEFALISYSLNSSPFDDFDNTKVNVRSNLILNFNKVIEINPSNSFIYLFDESDTLIQTFDLNATFADDQINTIFRIGGSYIMLNPTSIFEQGKTYYINTSTDAISDAICGEFLPVINSKTRISWTTDLVKVSPTESNVFDMQDGTLVLPFERDVVPGPGEIEVVDDLGNVLAIIPSNHPAINYN